MGQKKREETEIVVADTSAIESKVESAMKEASGRVIKTDEDQAEATKVLTNVKLLQKYVKQEKDNALKVPLETVKAIRGFYAPLEDKTDEAERVLRIAMGAYYDKKQAEEAKKIASIEKRAESGQLKEETAVRKIEELPEVKTTVRNEEGSVSFRKVRKVRFADLTMLQPADLKALVDQKFIVWDEAVARKAVLAGLLAIGTEIYEETEVATRV